MSEFKVGDRVVFLSTKSDDAELYVVEAILDGGRFLGINNYRQAFSSAKFRHAEPKEIEAKHRIDQTSVKPIADMGDDSPIENHISPNCKVSD